MRCITIHYIVGCLDVSYFRASPRWTFLSGAYTEWLSKSVSRCLRYTKQWREKALLADACDFVDDFGRYLTNKNYSTLSTLPLFAIQCSLHTDPSRFYLDAVCSSKIAIIIQQLNISEPVDLKRCTRSTLLFSKLIILSNSADKKPSFDLKE